MDLFEYQGKQLFARYGIPVSDGAVADTVDEAVAGADRVGYPVVVKAQVQVGGRGKAGGVKLANNTAEAREHAGNILGLDIKGHVVKRVWVEHASDIAEEYYASFTLDRAAKKYLGMLSAQGGVEIEQVAVESPDALARIEVDPVDGLSAANCRAWVESAKLNPQATEGAVDILMKLYEVFVAGDADLVEINPLILTPDGRVHALDAKVSLDDNARFRHPEWDEFTGLEKLDPREREAAERGLQYVGPRRRRRLDRERRGARDGDVRHRARGGRQARELPRHRRRRERAGDGERARGHQQRPVGEGDLHQHLRRDHQGRRGRQRDRAGARSGRHLVADRDPPRRHERRARPRDPEVARVGPAREQADDGGGRAHGRGDGGGADVSILVNADTKVIVQGSPVAKAASTGSATARTARRSSAV